MDSEKIWAIVLGAAAAGGVAWWLNRGAEDGDGGSSVAEEAVAAAGGSSGSSESGGESDRLECPSCGTTTLKDGTPITSQAQLNGHKGQCPEGGNDGE